MPRPAPAPHVDQEVTQIALAGDWEGDADWARARLRDAARAGVRHVFQLGDLRIAPGPVGKRYLRALTSECDDLDVTVYVTEGNHEDYGRLEHLKARVRDDMGAVRWVSPRVAFLPRGHRWTMSTPGGQTRSFVSLGGAPSVNAHLLRTGHSWWPQEALTETDVDHVATAGHAEVMLTHDAPGAPYQTPRVATICDTNPHRFPAPALAYATEGRAHMTRAFEAVAPRVLVHGHYHVHDQAVVALPDGRTCQVLSLAAARQAGNLLFLDLDTLSQNSSPHPPTACQDPTTPGPRGPLGHLEGTR